MTHEQLSAIETRIEELKEARWESVVSLASTIARDDAPALLAEVWRLRAELEAAKRDFTEYVRGGHEKCAYCDHDDECEPGESLCYANVNNWQWRGATENGGAGLT